MTSNTENVNQKIHRGAAPLKNIKLMSDLGQKIISAPEHLPMMGVMSGPSGFGKSTAAAFVAAKNQAYYLECGSGYCRKEFLSDLLELTGMKPKGTTISGWIKQFSGELMCSNKLLILDEVDRIAEDLQLLDIVRDIYEKSQSPILLIGEETLPQKLSKREHFAGRVMEYVQAEPIDLQDAETLNRHYSPEVLLDDDLLMFLRDKSRGSIRRFVTNLEKIRSFGMNSGLDHVGKAEWGNRSIHSADLPRARAF